MDWLFYGAIYLPTGFAIGAAAAIWFGWGKYIDGWESRREELQALWDQPEGLNPDR